MNKGFPTAWKVSAGYCWVQCRCPKSAKRLAKVKGAKLVAQAHTGPYLKTYEVPWTLERAKDWVVRTVKELHGTKKASIVHKQFKASLEVAA